MHSYGAWIVVAEMLTQKETVSLQVTCSYMYDVGVPRIQSNIDLTPPDPPIHPIFIEGGGLQPMVYFNDKTNECEWIDRQHFKSSPVSDLGWRTVKDGDDLILCGRKS